MEKIEIAPRILLKFSLDSKLLDETCNLIKTQEKFFHCGTNQRTVDSFILRKKQYKKLTKWINNCLEEVRKSHNFQCDSLKITQSWANASSFEQAHHAHIHPNSILSGIIYLTESDGPTVFGFNNDLFFMCDDQIDQRIKISYEPKESVTLYEHKVVPGDMILFPSNYRHNTGPHMLNDGSNRITISFNVFPSGKIGRFEDLSGLEIEVK